MKRKPESRKTLSQLNHQPYKQNKSIIKNGSFITILTLNLLRVSLIQLYVSMRSKILEKNTFYHPKLYFKLHIAS